MSGAGTSAKTALKKAIIRAAAHVPQRAVDSVNNLASYLELGQQVRQHDFGPVPRHFPDKYAMFEHMIGQMRHRRVLYLEFGVFEAQTFRFWLRTLESPEARFFGFDSFEGLPTTWNAANPLGHFSLGGEVPDIDDDRGTLVKGWLADTLPLFEPTAHDTLFVNVDVDLFSSTTTVLDHVEKWLEIGSYIYFDEYNDRCHEMRAFDDFLNRTGMRFEAVGVVENMWQWLFKRVA